MRRLLTLIALTLALAGCGGSTSSTTAATTTGSPPRLSTLGGHSTTSPAKSFTVTLTQTVTTPTPTTTTGTTTTGTTTTAGTGTACTAADLTPVFLSQNGATGHVILEVGLRNHGTASCHTYGYPGVQFLTRSGSTLPTISTRSTEDLVGTTPVQAITLTPGQEASFRMVAQSDVGGGGNCPTAYGLQVIAPDDTATLRISIPGGAYECGKTSVSPLQPGTDAAPGV